MTRRFGITIDPIEDLTERRFSLHVALYPTLADMRRAARRYHPEDEDLDDAGGCFQIAPGVQNGRSVLGTMRLAEECLTPWIVMHEAVHAGVALAFSEHQLATGRRRVNSLDLDPYLGGSWAEREELIAYGAHAFGFSVMVELGLIESPPACPRGGTVLDCPDCMCDE